MDPGRKKLHQFLLLCGIFSSIHYVVINIIVPMQYEGYRLASFTVSELSAIGAPTRPMWVFIVILYLLFFVAFGLGVWQSSTENRSLRMVARLILIYSAFNIYWPPMHMRGSETSLTDTLHITWASVTVLLMMIMMRYGAVSFGKTFRFYTFLSMVLLLIFGILTGLESPNIPINGPTPLIGVWERINIGIFLLWVIVLSITLLRKLNNTPAFAELQRDPNNSIEFN